MIINPFAPGRKANRFDYVIASAVVGVGVLGALFSLARFV